jgi:hypothetical protein
MRSTIFTIRLAVTLVKILKLTFNKQIGLYCCIYLTSLDFGIKVIVPKLRLCRGNSPFMKICEQSQIILNHIPEYLIKWSHVCDATLIIPCWLLYSLISVIIIRATGSIVFSCTHLSSPFHWACSMNLLPTLTLPCFCNILSMNLPSSYPTLGIPGPSAVVKWEATSTAQILVGRKRIIYILFFY